jgi:hypothetical protein
MKKKLAASFLFLFTILSFTSFAQDGYYGDKITPDGAITVDQLVKKMGTKTEMTAKVTGTVLDVCQAKGCWMTIQKSDGTKMRVTFKDYGFFVPKDIAGKTVIMEGVAKVTETSVEELRHYAEDAGKSKEEIKKITEPKKELTFEASGVIVKK